MSTMKRSNGNIENPPDYHEQPLPIIDAFVVQELKLGRVGLTDNEKKLARAKKIVGTIVKKISDEDYEIQVHDGKRQAIIWFPVKDVEDIQDLICSQFY